MVRLPSVAYEKWERNALAQLQGQPQPGYTTAVHIRYEFRFKGRLETDLDNAEAGINDILEKAGIITNDKLIKAKTVPWQQTGADWVTKITITPKNCPVAPDTSIT